MLNERAQVVQEIGHIKRTQQGAPPIYAPDRERQVFDRIKAINKGPLPDRCLIAVYRELMSGSFVLERPLRIAFLGPEGSFSHTAAILKFGQSVEYEPLPDITSVFDEITRQHCDLGIIPVENSIAGGVVETLDSFMETTVSICGEVLMEIHHNLLANCGLGEIRQVYSRPEIFSQCRRWLNATLPKVDLFPTGSSAVAAQKSAGEIHAAAIGSRLAAELYGLKIVCENIEDVTNNVTRFFVIGRESARPTGRDKTALVFATAHKAGALVDVLQAFRYNGVNLTNIESRPSRKRQREYCFFVDCQGHQEDANVHQALDEARRHCLQLSVLGSFPEAVELL
ncbi:MAG: prephenate dehydratase [Sedimentisphaerales bacterium]|nr:prephenate dehydratase [Sedimentisphaerales bacterium]